MMLSLLISSDPSQFIDFDQLSEIEDISSQECPERDGLFPHPTDCHLFIQCANNIAYVMQCPATTFFNDAIKNKSVDRVVKFVENLRVELDYRVLNSFHCVLLRLAQTNALSKRKINDGDDDNHDKDGNDDDDENR
uniref:Bm628 n=1 Tax=Brugia malayi TaxID=6279 RepID=A0A0J9XZV0_BRUMA|nr:Bm628 [Brugia malayi]